MGKNGLRMQKLSQKEDALCSLEKETKSPKMGKRTLIKGNRIGGGPKGKLKWKGEKPPITDPRHIRLEVGLCI